MYTIIINFFFVYFAYKYILVYYMGITAYLKRFAYLSNIFGKKFFEVYFSYYAV